MSLALIPPPSSPEGAFTPEQKEYLAGFMAGVAANGGMPFVGNTTGGRLTASPAQAEGENLAAEAGVSGTPVADLCKEERWKYDENPLDCWERLLRHADEDRFPNEEDTFRFKFFGLFHVAPAQDSFMLRLRIPACELGAGALHGLADLAADLGGGYAHVTTRGNLQIREFKPRDIIKVITRVQELGLTSRGTGADNIRNITASPNSGFDPDELLDVRPFAKGVHHYILNHRDLYGLPRKFNIAFDSGGSISVAADTNDIGFCACRVTEASLSKLPAPNSPLRTASSKPEAGGAPLAPGIHFRVQLGGITGHGDFARDAGLLIRPSESVAVAAAMLRVYSENGDRTNRKKARLKYLLEKWGVERFLEETQKKLAFPLVRLPSAACEPRRPVLKHGWIGVHRQAQRGLNSIGVGIPGGHLTARQMHRLADLATHYGKGELRLTVWQNLILPHISDAFVGTVRRRVGHMGFYTEASSAAGGLIACTGRRGCKYAATDTKGHAAALAGHLAVRPVFSGQPVNLHFTGCPHSCAQHYCGDLGFLGTKHPDGSEAYHVVLGGGMDQEQGIGREIFRAVRATEVPALVEHILGIYDGRKQSGESFVAWVRRHSVGELQEMFSG